MSESRSRQTLLPRAFFWAAIVFLGISNFDLCKGGETGATAIRSLADTTFVVGVRHKSFAESPGVIFFSGILSTGLEPTTGGVAALPEVRNVKSFGATGDGIQDDTAAIQKCVAEGGVIIFPPGIYRLTAPIEIRLSETGWIAFQGNGTARLVMNGPGPALRFVGQHRGTADPKRVQPLVWERERMPLVDGLEIVGNHAEACGIEAVQTMQLTITRTLIRETLHAIRLHERNRNVIISNCHIYHNRGIGVYLDDVDLHQINIVGCHISYNQGGGIVVRKGYLRNLQVTGCDIEVNMSPDGEPTANVLIDSTESPDGHAEIAITGCTIQHSLKAPGGANIRFIGLDAKGRSWGALTIAENVLSDVVTNVEIVNARGVSIVGNTFWGAGEEDLIIKNCRNIVIGPNSLDQNPNYAHQGPYRGGVRLEECHDCVINALQLAGINGGEAAIVLRNCSGLNVTNCQMTGCGPVGILLDHVSLSRISDSLLRGPSNEAGQSGDRTFVAVRTQSCRNVVVTDNLFEGTIDCPGEGVFLDKNVILSSDAAPGR
ncbi:right-handed parallel beta-helix repeat-containing protein [Thermogutta sp.]|uniref:right-handed parallel beta-helix repeat-containing protein n=1 Tax=Thermogutta sp. TaxID=1962930 RepID=UPI0032208FB5